MDYVNFGSAGIKVSPLAVGLGLRGQDNEAHAQRMLEHALELGINLIDCANVYGTLDVRENAGQSEIILGRVLQGRRDQVVITSKVAGEIGPGPNDGGLSRFHIMREVENSLRRLRTDYIDLYLVHVFDASTPLEETMGALDDLVISGKIRYAGCCNFDAWQVCKALWIADSSNSAAFMTIQNQYSLLNRQLEREMFDLVRDQGLGAMAYSPLAVGLLSGTYTPGNPAPEETIWATQLADRYNPVMDGPAAEVISTLIRLADEIGKSPAQLAFAWVLSHPEITVAISGSDNMEQIDDVVGSVGWTLDEAVRQQLDDCSDYFTRNTWE